MHKCSHQQTKKCALLVRFLAGTGVASGLEGGDGIHPACTNGAGQAGFAPFAINKKYLTKITARYFLTLLLQLHLPQLRIAPLLRQQLLVIALLHYLATLQHQYLVGIHHCG